MRYSRGLSVVAAFSLHLALIGCAAQGPLPHVGPAEWRADLQFLSKELTVRHANAFHTISRERFAAEVEKLDAAIPSLNDDQVLVGLMRLVALVGDGHTHLDPPATWPRYPIDLAWFGDELRIVAASGTQRDVVGLRVVGVSGVTLDSVMTLLAQLVPRGENDRRTRFSAMMLLRSPQVLHGVGLSASSREVSFALVTGAGKTITDTLTASPANVSDWRLATDQPPLWLRHLRETWFVEALPDAKTVYLSFNRYPTEAEFQQRVLELGRVLDSSGARRVVIDLRRNGGGDYTRGRRLLLPALKGRPALNHEGGVYVITGPATFSAAMVNALDLRQQLNATLVGEPTGGRPNSYAEHGSFLLPNSGLLVAYSLRHYRFGADSATAVEPDRLIEPTWQDFTSGRDPVLDWILTQPIG